ncbi:MAG: DUF3326 domain-containing protein, partial [Candidatus Hodarchaeota archaeon]
MENIMIKNNILEIEVENISKNLKWSTLCKYIKAKTEPKEIIVRIVLCDIKKNTLIFQYSSIFSEKKNYGHTILDFDPPKETFNRGKNFTVLNLIPTGVGAEIGGFAGDATPVTNLLASVCDYLITNPNSVTASDLYFARQNIIYLEGNLICHFMLNNIKLGFPKFYNNNIGVIIEKPKQNLFLNNVLNALNAMRATAGLSIEPVIISSEDFDIKCIFSEYGFSSGSFNNLNPLFNAFDLLIEKEINTAAIVSSLMLENEIREKYYNDSSIP